MYSIKPNAYTPVPSIKFTPYSRPSTLPLTHQQSQTLAYNDPRGPFNKLNNDKQT